MRELHLFAGAGGGILAAKLTGHRVIGYVEREPYRCRTLAQRIADGILDDAPVYCGTVRDFIDGGYATLYRGLVDCLCAGFPCPPFSLAGKRLADKDPRNAWPETRDAIAVIKPACCFLENVPGLITSPYLETVVGDLHALGYRVRATVLGAVDAGAPHIRKRIWMLAYPEGWKCGEHENGEREPEERRIEPIAEGCAVPHANDPGRKEHARPSAAQPQYPPLSALVQKIYPSPMPSDVRGGRTMKGSKRPNEGGLRKALFPTPRSEDGQSCGAHRGNPDTLTSFMKLWPTPKASSAGPDYAKLERSATGLSLQTEVMLRTPGKSDATRGPHPCPDARAGEHSLVTQVGGTLNPDWVELLMGWPKGWTSLAPMTREQFEQWNPLWPDDWEHGVDRVSVGVEDRANRLEAIGDGQVPAVAALAWRILAP